MLTTTKQVAYSSMRYGFFLKNCHSNTLYSTVARIHTTTRQEYSYPQHKIDEKVIDLASLFRIILTFHSLFDSTAISSILLDLKQREVMVAMVACRSSERNIFPKAHRMVATVAEEVM